MKRSAIILASALTLITVTYLGYDLLKGVVSPCETIFEQTSVRLGTKLEVLQTKGELHLGREKIQDLTEAAQVTALNLKTCCVVLNAGSVDSNEFLQCKNAAQSYEARVDSVIVTVEEASNVRDSGDSAAYQEMLRQLNEAIEEARQASEAIENDVNVILNRQDVPGTNSRDMTSGESMGAVVDQAIGELIFRWDGKTKAYWNIFQADSSGDYHEVAETNFLQKGQTQVVELAPSEYWIRRNTEGAVKEKIVVEIGGNTLITR